MNTRTGSAAVPLPPSASVVRSGWSQSAASFENTLYFVVFDGNLAAFLYYWPFVALGCRCRVRGFGEDARPEPASVPRGVARQHSDVWEGVKRTVSNPRLGWRPERPRASPTVESERPPPGRARTAFGTPGPGKLTPYGTPGPGKLTPYGTPAV